jgi:hypothetical protein
MSGGDEWCTKTPHLEGEEVFVYLKHKSDIAFSDERESHRPDKISISRPHVQTKSARLNDSPPHVTTPYSPTTPNSPTTLDSPTTTDEEQPHPPTHDAPQQLDRHHVTAIEETLCNPAQWHIARVPKTSAKACFALQAITKKKCVARLYKTGRPPLHLPTRASWRTIGRRDWILETSCFAMTILSDALRAQK